MVARRRHRRHRLWSLTGGCRKWQSAACLKRGVWMLLCAAESAARSRRPTRRALGESLGWATPSRVSGATLLRDLAIADAGPLERLGRSLAFGRGDGLFAVAPQLVDHLEAPAGRVS